uniref:NADH-ubiquinone oxidoreductase chain 4 n=1 Tax=Foenatopus ruficollis TaxID=1738635 RepID=A0A342I4E7_9HYME|nr:NADH dehydrogenase subunit 4 [Foenatopus ruficollis]
MKMISFLIMIMFYFFLFMKMQFYKHYYYYFQNMIFFFMLIYIMKINYMKNFFWVNCCFFFGIDKYSFGMLILLIWIIGLSFLASVQNYKLNFYSNYFCLVIFINFFSLILCFSVMNMFVFYFFFEVSLIFTLILLMGWGYQPERIQASLYMLFYTLFGSLPLLFMIMYMYKYYNSMDFYMLLNKINYSNFFIFIFIMISFLIKLPMFLFHLWLPKAHVESPISGSMILAGIMLKLGGYGIIRFMMFMLINMKKFGYFMFTICLFGGIYLSLVCLRQIDMKMLVAYSSVVHMGMMLMGVISMSYIGLMGGYYMMISHGLCSSGMFCLVNFLYERFLSRSILVNKGMVNFFPSMTLWWFLLCMSNMSAPPSMNLFSEVLLIISILMWNSNLLVLLIMMCFFSSLYSLYIYSFSQHGKLMNSYIYGMKMNMIYEYLLVMLHWIPLKYIFIKFKFFL